MNPELLSVLRDATRSHHTRLEQRMNILRPDFSLDDYQRLLLGFLGYYRPLERTLAACPGLQSWLPDYPRRIKTPLLERDLLALGHDPADLQHIPECGQMPEIHDRSQIMGCLYVMEGSTLGGQLLQRHFNQTLGLTVDTGVCFFAGYGPETRSLWQHFGACLVAAEPDEASVVTTACQTFTSLESWFAAIHRNYRFPSPRCSEAQSGVYPEASPRGRT